jgi:hypothetical protein
MMSRLVTARGYTRYTPSQDRSFGRKPEIAAVYGVKLVQVSEFAMMAGS